MTAIERERTALRRTALSSPIQHLLRFGFLDGRTSLFDYGCGHGDDLRLLREMGIAAEGWDPVFRPDAERSPAEVVNLGFVLNVIEDAGERRATLEAAYGLARKVLIVSVMLGYEGKREQFAAYQDGVRTQRNTFQKYFAQDEFRGYIESTLGVNAVPVAAGICLVFRDAMDEQLFLLARQQVRREWRLLRREVDDAAVAALIDEHREQIDAYWSKALELGRPACAGGVSRGAVADSPRRLMAPRPRVGRPLLQPRRTGGRRHRPPGGPPGLLRPRPLRATQAVPRAARPPATRRALLLRQHHQGAGGGQAGALRRWRQRTRGGSSRVLSRGTRHRPAPRAARSHLPPVRAR